MAAAVGDLVPRLAQPAGELRAALRAPPQRPLGIAAHVRIDEPLEIADQGRVLLGQPLAAPARAAHPARLERLTGVELCKPTPHGVGFHPLLCYEATTEEALAGLLRPGNAGFNTAQDYVEVLEQALAQLPEEALTPGLLVRLDRAGATHAFLDHVSGRGLRFSVGRRERPHPGAQLSFTDDGGYRFQVFLTNQQGRRIGRLEQLHRARAACEDRIRCGKDSGLRNLPFRAFQPNAAWLELVLTGQDLLCWTQWLLLQGTELARCEPKRLRYRLLHVAARLTRHARRLVLHLPRAWPWQRELLRAFERLRALPE